MSRFKAFISYKHNNGLPISNKLSESLRIYAKPPFKKPLKIFRDEDHFVPDKNLPKLIKEALIESEFLILLASKNAALSEWVQEELRIWCSELKRSKNLIIVLLDGHIEFHPKSKIINWEKTTSLPKSILEDHLTMIPLYIDLKWAKSISDLDIQNPLFKQAVNGISARLRDVDPSEMLLESSLQYKKTIRYRKLGLTILSLLTIIALVASWDAGKQRAEARAADTAAILELYNSMLELGYSNLQTNPGISLQLAIQCQELGPNQRPFELLRQSLYKVPAWSLLKPLNSKSSMDFVPTYAHISTPLVFNRNSNRIIMLDSSDTSTLYDGYGKKISLRSVPKGDVISKYQLKYDESIYNKQNPSDFCFIKEGLEESWDVRIYQLDIFSDWQSPIWEVQNIKDIISSNGTWPIYVLKSNGKLLRLDYSVDSKLVTENIIDEKVNLTQLHLHPSGRSLLASGKTDMIYYEFDSNNESLNKKVYKWPNSFENSNRLNELDYRKIGWGPHKSDLLILESINDKNAKDRLEFNALDLNTGLSYNLKSFLNYNSTNAFPCFFSTNTSGTRVALVRPNGSDGTIAEVFDLEWTRKRDDFKVSILQKKEKILDGRTSPNKYRFITSLAVSPNGNFVAVGTFLKDKNIGGSSVDGIGFIEIWNIAHIKDPSGPFDFVEIIEDPISNNHITQPMHEIGMNTSINMFYNNDGTKLISNHNNGDTRIFNVPKNPSWDMVPEHLKERLVEPKISQYGPMGKFTFVIYGDGDQEIYDLGESTQVLLDSIGDKVLDIHWSKKTETLIIASKKSIFTIKENKLAKRIDFPSEAISVRIGDQLSFAILENHSMFYNTLDFSMFGSFNNGNEMFYQNLLASCDRSNPSIQSRIEFAGNKKQYSTVLSNGYVYTKWNLIPNTSGEIMINKTDFEIPIPDGDWVSVRKDEASEVLWMNYGNYILSNQYLKSSITKFSIETSITQFSLETGGPISKYDPPKGGWPNSILEVEFAKTFKDKHVAIFRFNRENQNTNGYFLGIWNKTGGANKNWIELGDSLTDYENDIESLETNEKNIIRLVLRSGNELHVISPLDGKVKQKFQESGPIKLAKLQASKRFFNSDKIKYIDNLNQDIEFRKSKYWRNLTNRTLSPSLLKKIEEAKTKL